MRKASRVAVVTGGAQGIGKAIATRFLKEGMAVTVADVDADACHAAERELRRHGRVLALTPDVASEADVAAMIEETRNRFHRLDVLINNAGISIGGKGALEQLTLERWNRVIGVNLTGAFLCARAAAPLLRKSRGSIVNIASTRALMSEKNTEAYSASKGGIVALTHALSVSLGPAVRVNCISPGWIETSAWKKPGVRHAPQLRREDHEQHPAGRVGKPEDIAALAWFLVSEESGFITGANIVADGGMTRKMIYVE